MRNAELPEGCGRDSIRHSAFRIPHSKIGCPGWIRTINIRFQRPAFCWLNYRAWRSWPDSHRLTTGLKGPPLDCLALTNKLVHEAGSAPASPPLQGGANLPQLLVDGPSARSRSAVFRLSGGCSALELQKGFEIWRKASVTLRPRLAPTLFSRQVQPACICLPSGK